ncbi:MAG: hypothetical protein QOJ79_394 [Actinomycetota bacterium]|nr:hypothetical protein [Actinomycetota bacterium]
MAAHLLSSQLGNARPQPHPGGELLAVLLIRYADDLHVRDVGMSLSSSAYVQRLPVRRRLSPIVSPSRGVSLVPLA